MKPRKRNQNADVGVLMTLEFLCFTLSAGAQGSLVVNGGFDIDASYWAIANVYVPYGGGYRSNIGNPPGSVYLYNPNFGPSVPSPMASQEINSLTPGDIYIFSGDYKGGGKNATDNSFGVGVDGVFLFETVLPADSDWHSFYFDYTATSTSALLSLKAQINGTDDSYFIDNISIEAVPEPPARMLLCFGGILLLAFLSRRRLNLNHFQ